MDEYAICPICENPVLRDYKGNFDMISYMDGWHHKICLDKYLNGEVDLPKGGNNDANS